MNERQEFLIKAITQLNAIYGVDGQVGPNNDELRLLLFLHLFAYHFDDREPIKKNESEMASLAQATFVARVSPDGVGRIKALPRKDCQRLVSLEKNNSKSGKKKYIHEFTKYHLKNIRNCISHGDFCIKKSKSGEAILSVGIFSNRECTPGGSFRCDYNFKCICDICELLADRGLLNRYRVLLNAIKNGKQLDFSHPENKLAYFDLLIQLLYVYNERKFNNGSKEAQKKVNRFLNGIKGIGLINFDALQHARNSVTHHYRQLSGSSDELEIIDYEDAGRKKESFRMEVKFSSVISLGKNLGRRAKEEVHGYNSEWIFS